MGEEGLTSRALTSVLARLCEATPAGDQELDELDGTGLLAEHAGSWAYEFAYVLLVLRRGYPLESLEAPLKAKPLERLWWRLGVLLRGLKVTAVQLMRLLQVAFLPPLEREEPTWVLLAYDDHKRQIEPWLSAELLGEPHATVSPKDRLMAVASRENSRQHLRLVDLRVALPYVGSIVWFQFKNAFSADFSTRLAAERRLFFAVRFARAALAVLVGRRLGGCRCVRFALTTCPCYWDACIIGKECRRGGKGAAGMAHGIVENPTYYRSNLNLTLAYGHFDGVLLRRFSDSTHIFSEVVARPQVGLQPCPEGCRALLVLSAPLAPADLRAFLAHSRALLQAARAKAVDIKPHPRTGLTETRAECNAVFGGSGIRWTLLEKWKLIEADRYQFATTVFSTYMLELSKMALPFLCYVPHTYCVAGIAGAIPDAFRVGSVNRRFDESIRSFLELVRRLPSQAALWFPELYHGWAAPPDRNPGPLVGWDESAQSLAEHITGRKMKYHPRNEGTP